MGYKCTFMDNDVYCANDVNAIFANITSGGVVLKDSGNLLSDLNDANQQMVTEGVTRFADSCKIIVSDGVYKIGEGVCFMHDGSSITFDKDGYEINPPAGVKSYVYIERNYPENAIKVIVSEDELSGDVVKIAEIDEAGKVYDRREYARAKVKLDIVPETYGFDCVLLGSGETLTINLEKGDFSRIIVNTLKYPSGNTTATNYPCYHNLLEIKDGVEIRCALSRSENYSPEHIVYFTKNGSQLMLRLEKGIYGYPYTVNFEII